MTKNPSLCIYGGCKAPADYHAYSTVGAGHVHACATHAPAWLIDGRFSAFYSPHPVPVNEDLRRAAAERFGRLGGLATSPAKTEAARRNGRLGGRPLKAR